MKVPRRCYVIAASNFTDIKRPCLVLAENRATTRGVTTRRLRRFAPLKRYVNSTKTFPNKAERLPFQAFQQPNSNQTSTTNVTNLSYREIQMA